MIGKQSQHSFYLCKVIQYNIEQGTLDLNYHFKFNQCGLEGGTKEVTCGPGQWFCEVEFLNGKAVSKGCAEKGNIKNVNSCIKLITYVFLRNLQGSC